MSIVTIVSMMLPVVAAGTRALISVREEGSVLQAGSLLRIAQCFSTGLRVLFHVRVPKGRQTCGLSFVPAGLMRSAARFPALKRWAIVRRSRQACAGCGALQARVCGLVFQSRRVVMNLWGDHAMSATGLSRFLFSLREKLASRVRQQN